MARRTKLTPAMREKLVAALRGGMYADTAAELGGISSSTYYAWLDRGALLSLSPHGNVVARRSTSRLVEAVAAASATAEADAIDVIRRGDDWRAAAFFLERRFPDRWRRRDSHEHSGPDGGPIETAADWNLAKLSDRELELLQSLREKAVGDG